MGAAAIPETDEDLMCRVQEGEVEAFAELYDRHGGRAYRVALALCHDHGRAEDAVQEGFLSIWRSRTSYRPDGGSFQSWSMCAVRNRAIDSLRKEAASRRPQLAELPSEVNDRESASVQEEVVARSENDALRESLRQLPDVQAEVIALAYFGGLSHSEIAEQLALPTGTVKGRMRLGLEKLRKRIEARAANGS